MLKHLYWNALEMLLAYLPAHIYILSCPWIGSIIGSSSYFRNSKRNNKYVVILQTGIYFWEIQMKKLHTSQTSNIQLFCVTAIALCVPEKYGCLVFFFKNNNRFESSTIFTKIGIQIICSMSQLLLFWFQKCWDTILKGNHSRTI